MTTDPRPEVDIPTPQKTALLVTGMHRSGTSALTRLLSLLGAELPQHLIEGRPDDNEKGFWEGRKVVDLNQRILAEAGSWWGGWQSISHDAAQHALLVGEAAAVITAEYGDADLIAIKDPRISRLMPVWVDALESLGYRVAHVVCVRHPGKVADSLERRNAMGTEAAMLSWAAHSLDAEFYTREAPRVFISFDRLLREWRVQAARIAVSLDLTWPNSYESVASEVKEFLDPSLAKSEAHSIPMIGPIFRIMSRLAEGTSRPHHLALLDQWRARMAPMRLAQSPATLVGRRRLEAMEAYRNRGDTDVPRPTSPQVWNPILNEAYSVEAQASWGWFEAEPLQHVEEELVEDFEAPVSRRLAVRRQLGRIRRAVRARAHRLQGRDTDASRERAAQKVVPAPAVTGPTNFGPAMDQIIERAIERQRPEGEDPDYDLLREHFDLGHFMLQARPLHDSPRVDPIRRFMRRAQDARFSPDINFHQGNYLARYPERTVGRVAPYLAWLKEGRAAGEIADPAPRVDVMAEVLDMEETDLVNHLVDTRSDLRDRLRTGTLGQMFARAAEIEPLIGDAWVETTAPKLAPLVAPGVVAQMSLIKNCHEQAGYRRARLVLVINRPRWGGGRRVEGHITHALAATMDPADIVVIHTDAHGETPPGRYPEGVREVDFAGLADTNTMGAGLKRRALVELIRSFRADAVVNINSRLLYDALPDYGLALTASERLFLMFFCNEQTSAGTWVGYPLRHFYRYFDLVEGVIADSEYLVDWLVERHAVPEQERQSLHVFSAPVDQSLPVATPSPPGKGRPQVFWAGRWDRQKRIDVVLEIARRMPDVDFRMWGEAVLNGPMAHEVPSNVQMEGRYEHITDLDLNHADAWLYTSAWDGVPSQLLEVGMMGVPIVGTLVGGTGELITPQDAWPIAEGGDAAAYEAALREVLADPEAARRRALALRDRLSRERTEAAYAEKVLGVLFPTSDGGER